MTNLERLKMEIKGVDSPNDELIIYLMENELVDTDEYDAKSKTNLKQIYQTALSVLEGIANDPTKFKNYKSDDLSVSMFSKNLNERIDYLSRKIRLMPTDNDDDFTTGASIGYLFTE